MFRNSMENVKEEDKKTYKIISTMMVMKKRPGMYFGKPGRYFDLLLSFLAGYGFGTGLYDGTESFSSSDIASEVWDILEKEYDITNLYKEEDNKWEKLSDDEKYNIYIDTSLKVFAERYPEYAKELGIEVNNGTKQKNN